MGILDDRPARVHSDAVRKPNVHTEHQGEPPELELFERLVEARHAHDFAITRPLLTSLRRLGYQIVMVAPKPAGGRS